jgi:hypothetical protein
MNNKCRHESVKKPTPPQGWVITGWNYTGNRLADYPICLESRTIFSIANRNSHDDVYLKLLVDRHGKPERFAAYRTHDSKQEELNASISSAKDGIHYCRNVAARYMDLPSEKVPNSEESRRRSGAPKYWKRK